MSSRRARGRVLVRGLAAAVAVAVGVAPAANGHPGGKAITAARAQSELVKLGIVWGGEVEHTITSARCTGEGAAIRRGGRRLFRHFRCVISTRQTLPYRIRVHYIGANDRTYAADFLGWMAAGSREQPIPLGTAAPVGDGWTLKVVSVKQNATAEVLAYQQAVADGEPTVRVDPGNQLVLAHVVATRTAASPRVLDELALHVVGASNVASRHLGCGEFPGEMPFTSVFPGGTIEGNLCWQMPTGDASSLVMYDEFAPPYLFFSLVP